MSVDRCAKSRRVSAALLSLLLTVSVTLVACSNTSRGVTGSVGVGIGVALITPGSVTQITPGETLVITASLTNDNANGGVVWTSQGAGSLAGATTSQVTYVAPTATFAGAVSATITATSVSNPTYYAQVTILTIGTPSFDKTTLFPANVSVAYSGSFSVSGGTQPFTWALATGSTVPPGLVLEGSTTGLDSVFGTPTTPGVYTFTVTATDANSLAVSQTVSLTVNPQATCIISGSYSLMASGFRGGGGYTHVASININATGGITGEQDYKDGHRVTTHEVLSGTSNCINRETNSGQIQLESATGAFLYNFSVTPPDADGKINSARLQLIGSGSDTGSGLMALVDPTTTTIPTTPPSGDFAFGVLGTVKQEPDTVHYATAGRFTTDATGTISSGLGDTNLAPAQIAAALSGVLSAPDASGRGTATLTLGSTSSSYVYYLISFNAALTKMYLMNIDPVVGSALSSGFLTSQVGNAGVGTFDATALASPGILTLWGAISGAEPITVQTMARLSNANSAAGTLDALVDITNRTVDLASQTILSQAFTVDPGTGRATLTINATAESVGEDLAIYLDGVSDGYVVEQNTDDGSGGLLELQYLPAGGYPDTFGGFFVGGTQFAMAAGPITLTPLVTLSFGTLSSSFTNGLFYIDANTGRGFGTLTQSGESQQSAALYEVSPTKMDLMRFSLRAVDGGVDWLVQN